MKIIHLSDLHFGTEKNDLVDAVLSDLQQYNPDLTIISGDFTQIGSTEEFKEARAFNEEIPTPVLCVPGNHDVPCYNLIERFTTPLRKYKKYIHGNLRPVYENEQVIIAGINSARRILPHWNWANGAVSDEQIEFIKQTMPSEDERYKILVLHHPLHKAEGVPLDVVVFNKTKVMDVIHQLGIDLVLTGHVHHASVNAIKNTVFLSAATALSSRIRYQENGYNIIDVRDTYFEITHRTIEGKNFKTELVSKHKKTFK